MEDLKISDEEPPRPVYGGGPLVRALAARQIGRHTGPRPAVHGVNRAIEELAENKLIDRGEDFQALQCQLGGATRYRYRTICTIKMPRYLRWVPYGTNHLLKGSFMFI